MWSEAVWKWNNRILIFPPLRLYLPAACNAEREREREWAAAALATRELPSIIGFSAFINIHVSLTWKGNPPFPLHSLYHSHNNITYQLYLVHTYNICILIIQEPTPTLSQENLYYIPYRKWGPQQLRLL